MKRIIALILSCLMLLALTACGTEQPETTTVPETTAVPETTVAPTEAKTLSAREVLDSLKAQLGDSYGCSADEEEAVFAGYYGLDLARINSWASQQHAVTAANMDMAIVIETKDGYAEEAAAALQKGFEQKAGYAQLYNMDLARIGEARLFVQGNFVALLLLGQRPDEEASQEEQAKFAAAEGEKVDAAWNAIFGEVPENIIVIPEPDAGGQGGGMRPGIRPRG